MSTHPLDVYLRQLVLEAIRLEAKQIRVRDDGAKTHIEFIVGGENVPYPHAPHRRYGRLMPRLNELAGAETGRVTVPYRDSQLPLDVTFSHDGVEESALISLKHVSSIKPVA